MVESGWFIVYEGLAWILDKLWTALVMAVCVPIALLGLMIDKLRHVSEMCPRKTKFHERAQQAKQNRKDFKK